MSGQVPKLGLKYRKLRARKLMLRLIDVVPPVLACFVCFVFVFLVILLRSCYRL